ncbi:MAG: ABC transporter ATP-binding protein [Christensenellaceae bacterium]|jgi:putative ABC transport system ATP-binding protein|nr:ABC transporter ATP-binding protein [Christensenellaceae bacterium]
MHKLEIQALNKTFNQGTINEKVAIHQLSLNFEEGEFVTVIGGNGAGKSTLLNLIAGVYPADSGKVILDGRDITKMPEHKRACMLGRVFQDPMMGTASDMGIEENLAMAYRRGKKRSLRWGISAQERDKYREKLRSLDLGLEGRLSTRVGLLSGGQRQALTLLMATLQKPNLLLLDEHTAALDPRTAAKVLELSDRIIAKHGLTTMMVTHNMRDAIEHGNRLIMMHEGAIVLDIAGEAKKKLTVEGLIEKFSAVSGQEFANDRALLS